MVRLHYAAFVGGPVALAWSRFDAATRALARRRYVDAIAPWRAGTGYRVPGEFVVVGGVADDAAQRVDRARVSG